MSGEGSSSSFPSLSRSEDQRLNGTGANSSAEIASSTEAAGLLRSYQFPDHKLKKTLDDTSRTPLVLIVCGSFSPITYLHLRMLELAYDYVRRKTQFELVGEYISPVSDDYKKSGLASANHRISMCELACQSSARTMVDPWEAVQAAYTRTALVLDHFHDEINMKRKGIATTDGGRKECRIAMLAGADLIDTFSTPGLWSDEDLDHILGRYGLFVVERSGTNLEEALDSLQKWRSNIHIIEQLIKNDVSSTKIRAFLKKDLSVRYLLDPKVIEYIEEWGLYDDEGRRPHSRSRSLEAAQAAANP